MKINPEYERLLPRITPEEYKSLKNSIKQDGLYYPIVVNPEQEILDGHNRYKICLELGIKPLTEERKFDNKLLEKKFVIETNLERRHLNDFQKSELGMLLLPIEQELAKQRQIEGKLQIPLGPNETKGKATEKVAEKIGVSRPTFERARRVIEKAPEQIKDMVRTNEVSISKAHEIVKDIETEEQTEKLGQKLQALKEEKGELKERDVEEAVAQVTGQLTPSEKLLQKELEEQKEEEEIENELKTYSDREVFVAELEDMAKTLEVRMETLSKEGFVKLAEKARIVYFGVINLLDELK